MGKKLIQVSEPAFKNLSLIPHLYRMYLEIYDPPKGYNVLIFSRMVFVVAIIKLYDPGRAKNYRGRMISGLRKMLSETMNLGPTNISHMASEDQNYERSYKKFAERVESVRSRLSE